MWSRDTRDSYARISDSSSSPFIVFMESTNPHKSLGRNDQMGLADKIDKLISGGREILSCGQSQVKIFCDDW